MLPAVTPTPAAGESNPYALIDKKFRIGDGQDATPIMRAKLAREWNKLSDVEKSSLRSVRARRGIKCHVCGLLGVFRENCPRGCTSPFSTPENSDSDDDRDKKKTLHAVDKKPKMVLKKVTKDNYDSDKSDEEVEVLMEDEGPGLGVLWGNLGVEDQYRKELGVPDLPKKKKEAGAHHDELEFIKLYKNRERKRLSKSDARANSFDFFTIAEEGYSRNLSEMTLHQIMRRLMRLLQGQLEKNSSELESVRDSTLLHPPLKAGGEKFYPKGLADVPEYRDYYYQKQKKADMHKKNYQHKGSMRTVDSMDAIFRAGSDGNELYTSNPKAGACMHSKIGWKNLLAKNDALASSDPAMIKKAEAVEKLFAQQGQWVKNQNQSMVQLNDRFEHLIFVLKDEMEREHQRESRVLLAGVSTQDNSKGNSGVNMEVSAAASTTKEVQKAIRQKTKVEDVRTWVDRLEAVDRIVLTLQQYELVSGLDEVDFLLFCLNKWKRQCQIMIHGHGSKRRRKGEKAKMIGESADNSGSDSDSDGGVSKSGSEVRLPKKKATSSKGVAVGGINPYEASLGCLPNKPVPKKKGSVSTLHLKGSQREDAEREKHRAKPSAMSNLIMQAVSMAGLKAEGKSEVDQFADIGDNEPPKDKPKDKPTDKEGVKLPIIDEEGSVTSLDVAVPPVGDFYADAMGTGKQESTGRMVRTNSGNSMSSKGSNSNYSASTGTRATEGKSVATGGSTRMQASKKLNPREQDKVDKRAAIGSFKRAGLTRFIRSGSNEDIAYKCPALIPIPQAFTKGESDADLHSYVGNQMVQKFRKNMVLSDLGYTPQKMLPLYVRNTLFEKNGTSAGGDQTNETMSKDGRYTHNFGRPLNRFEPPDEYNPDLVAPKVHVLDRKKEEERLKELEVKRELRRSAKAEKVALKTMQEEARCSGLNMSLARLVFGDGRGPKGKKVINHYYD